MPYLCREKSGFIYSMINSTAKIIKNSIQYDIYYKDFDYRLK